MPDRLPRDERLAIIAELCPKQGRGRACDSSDAARERANRLLGLDRDARHSADYILMRAIDRYLGGRLTEEDLFRCRVLAYYMVFADGGEEWQRWGVAAGVHPGTLDPLAPEHEPAEPGDPVPDGPPWR